MSSHNQLGLLVKGLLRSESKDDFERLPTIDHAFRGVEGLIQKAAYSTDNLGAALNFGLEASLFLSTLHNSILDSATGFRLAPINTPIVVVDGVVVGIIGENRRLPVAGSAARYSLSLKKTGSIRVFTKETALGKSNENESFINRGLREDVTACSNRAFVESVLLTDSNTTVIPSAGETSTQILQTLNTAAAALDLKPTSSLYLVTDVATCASLATKTDGDGAPAFPNLHAIRGGEVVNGIRLIPVGADELPEPDSDGRFCTLFDADGVLLNRGQVYFGRTEDGSMELNDQPGAPGSGNLISLYQSECVALKSVRTFAVQQIRNCAVSISGVEW